MGWAMQDSVLTFSLPGTVMVIAGLAVVGISGLSALLSLHKVTKLMNRVPRITMQSEANLAVECTSVKKVFGSGVSEVQALRGIDLQVEDGEIMMLVGPSGCGKTTLISVIAGVLDATGGECKVFGQTMQDMTNEARTRYRGRTLDLCFSSSISFRRSRSRKTWGYL